MYKELVCIIHFGPVTEMTPSVQAEIKKIEDKAHEGIPETEVIANDLKHHLANVKTKQKTG